MKLRNSKTLSMKWQVTPINPSVAYDNHPSNAKLQLDKDDYSSLRTYSLNCVTLNTIFTLNFHF